MRGLRGPWECQLRPWECTLTASTDTLTASKALSRPLQSTSTQLACNREFNSTFSRLWECCWGRKSVVYSLFCNSLIEEFGSGSITLTNGSGSGRVDPDPDTDRNESTNLPISKWNFSVSSKNFETKPKLIDVFQLLFWKSKTFQFFQKILEQNQNFLMCSKIFLAKAKCYFIIQKNLDIRENVLVW